MDEPAATLDVKVAVGQDGDSVETPSAGRAAAGIPGGGCRDAWRAGGQRGRFTVARRRNRAVQSWLADSSRRSIKLGLGGDVLELTGVSSREQARLTDAWLARHADSR